MKSKRILQIGFVSVLVFIAIASYVWYKFFDEGKGIRLNEKTAIMFLNNGGTNYINATTDDPDSIIPVYYFRVKNNTQEKYGYEVVFINKKASEVNDGCTDATTFQLDELMYELKKDNRVISAGLLSELNSNIIDSGTIGGEEIYDYSFRVWLRSDIVDYSNKHFHYVIELKEK